MAIQFLDIGQHATRPGHDFHFALGFRRWAARRGHAFRHLAPGIPPDTPAAIGHALMEQARRLGAEASLPFAFYMSAGSDPVAGRIEEVIDGAADFAACCRQAVEPGLAPGDVLFLPATSPRELLGLARWLGRLWLPRLSITTMSPSRKSATRICSTWSRKALPLIG